ncbi:LysR substrate-binding domain-containing protein [Segnochrobactraceae bacterium EtOH-i3]
MAERDGGSRTTLAGLSLRDLEYVVAVAEEAHFGRAAERCGVSQPGLSEQVRKLEALIGVALFERSSRRVALTPEGEKLIPQAERVLTEARLFLELAGRVADPLAGLLRVGVIATLGPYYVPHILKPLRAAHPGLDLRLTEGRTASLIDLLKRGDLDLVLAALPVADDTLTTEPLFFEPFDLACPAGTPLARRSPIVVDDLGGDDLLLLEEGHCLRDQALSLCSGDAAHGAPTRFASSLEMLRAMIAAGEGHSLLPRLATLGRDDLEGLMVVRALADPDAGRTIGLIARRSDPRCAAFATLATFLRATAPAGTRATTDCPGPTPA